MLIPLLDNVLVAGIRDPDTWYGSSVIVRPESTKDRMDQGIVKAVGPGVQDIRVGDYVLFNPYSGVLINDADEGRDLVMLREVGCVALITNPTTLVDGLFVQTENGYEAATAEAAILIIRHAYHSVARVIEQKQKFEGRFGT